MITIAMVHKPLDSNQHMWSINCEVFQVVYDANHNWPGVKAYRLTGQEKYYEPTWVPPSDEGEQSIRDTSLIDFEPVFAEMQHTTEVAEDAVPSTERVEEDSICSSVPREPLTFIDLKVQQ